MQVDGTSGRNGQSSQETTTTTTTTTTDNKHSYRVLDTLEAMTTCLQSNEQENIMFYPRDDRKDLGSSEADLLARALEANTSLVTLTLEEVFLSNVEVLQRVVSGLLAHTNIKRLTLYDNLLGDEGAATLANMMLTTSTSRPSFDCPPPRHQHTCSSFASLQALCLVGNHIGDRGAYWIAQALKNNNNTTLQNLRELDLSTNEITEQGTIYLADMVGHSSLTAFILNGNQANVKGALALAKALHQNQQFDVLGLCGNDIGDEGAIQLAKVAKTHPTLKAMLLEDNLLGERGILAVMDAHRQNERLGMMEVSWNVISAPVMQHLVTSMDNVLYLYLDHCELGDAHLMLLSNGLRSNQSIRDLFLEGNHIGLAGTQALATALEDNDCLEGVFLDGNRITRRGAFLLRDVLQTTNMRLKRLQIHDDYHDIQREIDVYLDMNGAGRKVVLQSSFPASLWSQFLVHKEVLWDADLMYLFLKERPELFQRQRGASSLTGFRSV